MIASAAIARTGFAGLSGVTDVHRWADLQLETAAGVGPTRCMVRHGQRGLG